VTGLSANILACLLPSAYLFDQTPVGGGASLSTQWAYPAGKALPDSQEKRRDALCAPTCQPSAGKGTGDPSNRAFDSPGHSPTANQAMNSGIST